MSRQAAKITLKTLCLATEQEVFDQVARHLLSQRKRSTTTSKAGRVFCAYKSPDGLENAAGCLISDEEYSVDMEDNDWIDLVKEGIVPKQHEELIRNLQILHDRVCVDDWQIALEELAKKRNLDFYQKI